MADVNQSGIYEITSPSGKRYIGSATCFRRRWSVHRSDLQRNKHHCKALQRAFNKYGCALEYRILEVCPKDALLIREQSYIDTAEKGSLYNSALTAGSCLGTRHSAETRAKMRESHKGRVVSDESRAKQRARRASEETKLKMSEAQRGRVITAQQRDKLRLANYGKKATEETRRKMSAAQRGKILSSNSSGHSGVYYRANRGTWYVCFVLYGRRVSLGTYPTAELAGEARSNFERVLNYYSHS